MFFDVGPSWYGWLGKLALYQLSYARKTRFSPESSDI